MILRGYSSRIMASACVLVLFMILSGCGAIFDLLLRDRQSEQDDAFCASKCSGFKENDHYRHCLQECKFDQSLERSKVKDDAKRREREQERAESAERERAESDKVVTDKILKGLGR
jgi:hypothetical protein